jgi:hypothetical protein
MLSTAAETSSAPSSTRRTAVATGCSPWRPSLVAALLLRWHTKLAGRIEQALMDTPSDLESAVLAGWRSAAADLVGVRQILDAYGAAPTSPEMERALSVSHRKDWVLMAVMAGRASASDPAAVRVGRRLEEKARAAYDPTATPRRRDDQRPVSLLGRLRSRLAA